MNKNKVIIIAEAGVNHNGQMDIAYQLIDKAAEIGADYIKFQTFVASKNISKLAPKAEYQNANYGEQDSQLEMVRKYELSREMHLDLIRHCELKKIKFFSTAFDDDSITLLEELGLPLYKVPSGEITNLPYLRKIASLGKPVILSTGMANMGEIETAVNILMNGGLTRDMITILHCNTEYPTAMKDVNLNAMLSISEAFKTKVGYSDHTLGIEIPIAAVALGATVIEKHFTLDKNMEGPDHKASLEPEEFGAMIHAIRNIESAMGDGIKKPSDSERKNIAIARKSIHTARTLKAGEELQSADLIMLRPGDGISPMELDHIIGKKINKDLEEGHKLTLFDLQ